MQWKSPYPKVCEVAAAVLRPKDVFGPLGGEEFVVLLPGSSIEVERLSAGFVSGLQSDELPLIAHPDRRDMRHQNFGL
jgi:GGDEF domain-containing protein